MNQTACFPITEIDLSYKAPADLQSRPVVTDSRTAYDILLQSWQPGKLCLLEQFRVILLNRAKRVLGILNHSSGSTTGTVVDIRLLMVAALKANSLEIILCHNHPSGNLKPSSADIALTKKIVTAASSLELQVLDHLIVTEEGYYSFADNGNL